MAKAGLLYHSDQMGWSLSSGGSPLGSTLCHQIFEVTPNEKDSVSKAVKRVVLRNTVPSSPTGGGES